MATAQAIARLTELSNRRLVDQICQLAQRYGVTDPLDVLTSYKPNIKDPAQSMLRERELVSAVLDAVLVQMGADSAPGAAAPPPPRRTAATRKATD